MVQKYNYNNPVMTSYLKRASQQKHVNVSGQRRRITNGYSNGYGRVNQLPVVTTYVVQKESNSTIDNVSAGLKIASASFSGIASIIRALPASGGVTKNKAVSTTKDDTSYKTTVSETSPYSSKDVKSSVSNIESEIKNYEKTGEYKNLQEYVSSAKTQKTEIDSYKNNKQSEIDGYKAEYDNAKDVYDKYHDGEYKTAVDTEKAKNEEYTQAKNNYDRIESSNTKQIAKLNDENTSLQKENSVTIPGQISDLEKQLSELKEDDKNYEKNYEKIQNSISELNKKMEQNEKQIEQNKKDIEAKQKEINEAKNDRDTKQTAWEEAAKEKTKCTEQDKLNQDSMNLSKTEYDNIKSRNKKEISSSESQIKDLDSAINKGTKSLGSRAK